MYSKNPVRSDQDPVRCTLKSYKILSGSSKIYSKNPARSYHDPVRYTLKIL